MSILRMCQAYLRQRRQKGQIIVFTAVLLPFIIAMCGLTVDFGNMYLHKSKLQNAADAAAIAGAYAYAENNESRDNHPKATAASRDSIKANLPNTTLTDRSKDNVAVNEENNVKYYCVRLTTDVPIYFLRLFNVGNTAEVAADAYASITSTGGGGGGIFDNLFTFGKPQWGYGFESVQANEAGTNEPITKSSIYEGNIKYIGAETDDALKSLTSYRHQLLNKAALDAYNDPNSKIKTVGDAINDSKYYTVPSNTTSTTLDSELSGIINAAATNHYNKDTEWKNGKSLSQIIANSTDANKPSYAYYKDMNHPDGWSLNNIDNPELTVNISLPQGTEPFFVVLDTSRTVKLTISNKTVDKNSRPIIFVYTGEQTINVEAQNSFFHGIIYAPNATVHINDYGMNFYGSIAAKGIQLKQKAYYEIDKKLSQYFGGSSGSGSGSSSGSGSTSIGLTSPPSGFSWD